MIDVCIVGGGMVGSACALGLARLGLSVTLIEHQQPQAFAREQKPDLRVSALNLNTEQFFQSLEVWQDIKDMRSCTYKRLSVWENKGFRTDFDSAAIKQSHLGHIVENRVIQLALHQAFSKYSNLRCVFAQNIQKIEQQGHVSITLQSGENICARVLIGADGLNSVVRQAANIGVQGWQYSQQALGITIETKAPQQDITWQQFTPQGPLAFLPLFDRYASLVWYNHSQQIDRLKKLTKHQLKQEIIRYFPNELVDFDVLQWANFPLTRMHANQYCKGNIVLLGDAAHSINPLAGQGVNLGFKDVQVLLEVFANNQHRFQPIGSVANNDSMWLMDYEKLRRRDNLLMMSAMDILYAGFGNNIAPLRLLRNVGLKLANHAGFLKTRALQYAVGIK
ncbi:FAD-dependent oxidoreductase [Paraglaciecola hydrolytica]|uniref:2-octaprenyl-3-methyl-6-methoxy-1,4-benzoquinol hydroxylase n=1 Tax=Paraglaciecola hydrolytica TaxID=1799789 RepID=A0A136A6A1_9ALTE|nr:FAD-dependent oxidoreductase [Paraglaciecola hydrolytica]KXI30741.1 2-octaprenyl-3-methyl-6-methoxy-1,4-benzoquinol hydroxylase [Paraglaciecola hydrolytica]